MSGKNTRIEYRMCVRVRKYEIREIRKIRDEGQGCERWGKSEADEEKDEEGGEERRS